jgi:hypothetical protein
MDFFDDPDVKAYLDHAEKEMLPKMKDSALTISLFHGEVDIKQCLEIGAAILLDKPIILVASKDKPIPANLKRVASAIIECDDTKDPSTWAKVNAAISKVLDEDRRVQETRDQRRADNGDPDTIVPAPAPHKRRPEASPVVMPKRPVARAQDEEE